MTPEELSRSVREAFGYAARYLSELAATESASQLLARPDVEAVIADVLERAAATAGDAVRETWAEHGGPPHRYLDWLAGDSGRSFHVAGELRRAVREGPDARAAVLDVGARVALRAQLTLEVAATAARTARQIANGEVEEAAGFTVWKQWRTSHEPPDDRTCHWCRALDRVTVPLHDDFPTGSPADLSGSGHLTHPPRAYRGVLPGPPRHPRCRCHVVILTHLPAHQVTSPPGGQEDADNPTPLRPAVPGTRPRTSPGLLAASDVRALDEGTYQALVHFLVAATHELAQGLARLREVAGQ